jgi:hypothetical protein
VPSPSLRYGRAHVGHPGGEATRGGVFAWGSPSSPERGSGWPRTWREHRLSSMRLLRRRHGANGLKRSLGHPAAPQETRPRSSEGAGFLSAGSVLITAANEVTSAGSPTLRQRGAASARTCLGNLDLDFAFWPQRVGHSDLRTKETLPMRGILLWLIGIPIPIIILLWLFGVLH